MDTPARRPNILHLRGITLTDFVPIEDVFDTKILEAAEKEETLLESVPHEKIPAVFTCLKDWPLTTNLRCWSCVFSFDGPPCFIPTFVRLGAEGESSVEIGVLGNFCTFNCAARYTDDFFPPQAFAHKHWRMRDNLCLVYYYFTGQRVTHIKPAPPKTERLEFGGPLSEDEFWDQLRELDPRCGLRDHRPGTVIPERLRSSPRGVSVWEICRGGGAAPARQQAGGALAGETDLASTAVAGKAARRISAADEAGRLCLSAVEKTSAADRPAPAESEMADFDQVLEKMYGF